jgi:hypothetical protein
VLTRQASARTCEFRNSLERKTRVSVDQLTTNAEVSTLMRFSKT